MLGKKLRLHTLGALVLALVVVACGVRTPEETPTLMVAAAQTATPTATPAPQVRGIYTPEDMQWQYDEWPDDCKFAIDEEVVVRFAFPDRMTDWIGAVFVDHIPSFSAVTLDYGGEITHEHYGSEDGRARLQAALCDPALMARIRKRADQIWGDAQPGYADLLEALRERGATVEPGGGVSDPFFSVEGRMMVVNGAEVGVFEYPGPATAAFEAGCISPDGNMVKLAEDQVSHAFWVAPPHFYRQGKLIVLYVGDDEVVLGVLEAVLGEPFAGG